MALKLYREIQILWSALSIRIEITSDRRTISNDSKLYAILWMIYIKLLERYRLKPKRASSHKNNFILDLLTRYIYNWIQKIIHYRERNHTMQYDICSRDKDTPVGKRECDRKILAELNALVPKGRRGKSGQTVGTKYQLLKHRIGLCIDDLKNVLCLLNKSMIYGLQI